MHESEFGRKSYGRLKIGIKFKSKALRNFVGGCENFAGFMKISQGLRKFSTFFVFVFFLFFFMFNPLENSYQPLKSVRLRFKTKTHKHISSQHFSFNKSNTKLVKPSNVKREITATVQTVRL